VTDHDRSIASLPEDRRFGHGSSVDAPARHLRECRECGIDRLDARRQSLYPQDHFIRYGGLDDQPFKIELDPGNPAADDKGFVKLPNVNLLVELADMREANRSYEANLQVVKQSGDLTSMTIGLLKD
jgi:hypothetical protein